MENVKTTLFTNFEDLVIYWLVFGLNQKVETWLKGGAY